MVLKHQQLLKTPLFGLEEDEITWFSNSKRFSDCCTVGFADVKLHGAQTGFLRCADEFPAWKGELHGTQTCRCIEMGVYEVWKKIKLHGTQTVQKRSDTLLISSILKRLYQTFSILKGCVF